jgi:SAM-dependent methyltransferase
MPAATESSLRDPTKDWAAFSPDQIPTKGIKLPGLFHDTLRALEQDATQQQSLQILELGCGCGELCAFLQSRQHKVIGTDINHGAIASANENCLLPGTCFVADVTIPNFAEDIQSKQQLAYCGKSSPNTMTTTFDFVILQLLLSIVGGPASRKATLQNAISLLRPSKGTLYLSCSGISHDINPNYAQLYQADRDAMTEPYSYFSRNEQGEILYTTHHFSEPELKELLQEAGLVEIHIEQHKEASSRRPNEAAYFFYATAKRPMT